VGKCLLHAQNEYTIAALNSTEKVYQVAASREEAMELNGCVEEVSQITFLIQYTKPWKLYLSCHS